MGLCRATYLSYKYGNILLSANHKQIQHAEFGNNRHRIWPNGKVRVVDDDRPLDGYTKAAQAYNRFVAVIHVPHFVKHDLVKSLCYELQLHMS